MTKQCVQSAQKLKMKKREKTVHWLKTDRLEVFIDGWTD